MFHWKEIRGMKRDLHHLSSTDDTDSFVGWRVGAYTALCPLRPQMRQLANGGICGGALRKGHEEARFTRTGAKSVWGVVVE